MVNNLQQISATLDVFLAGDSSLPQAYLFIGAESLTRQVAEDFAGKILSRTGGVAHLPHADSLQYDAGVSGGIESVREVLQMAALMPVQSQYKTVLMMNMHTANPQMMNALLKTLEEPPQHTVFLLTSVHLLLPTVMSRCQVFNVPGRGVSELAAEAATAVSLLEQNRSKSTAEKMALVAKLADLSDETLTQTLTEWLNLQTSELKQSPQKHTAVRSTMETLQALRGNFNKKMVLQNFVLTGLL